MGGGAARGGRRLRAGRGAARRRASASASRRCARPGTTPSTRGRWASACSPTWRWPPGTRSTRSAPSGSSCSTGTCTTATAPTRSSTSRARCCSRASTSTRSIRAPGRCPTSAPGAGEGFSLNLPVPAGLGRGRVLRAGRARGAARRARVRPRPGAGLGRLRRPPRRPAGRLHARDLAPTRSSRARCSRSASRWATCSRAATTSTRWPARWRPRWRCWPRGGEPGAHPRGALVERAAAAVRPLLAGLG